MSTAQPRRINRSADGRGHSQARTYRRKFGIPAGTPDQRRPDSTGLGRAGGGEDHGGYRASPPLRPPRSARSPAPPVPPVQQLVAVEGLLDQRIAGASSPWVHHPVGVAGHEQHAQAGLQLAQACGQLEPDMPGMTTSVSRRSGRRRMLGAQRDRVAGSAASITLVAARGSGCGAVSVRIGSSSSTTSIVPPARRAVAAGVAAASPRIGAGRWTREGRALPGVASRPRCRRRPR